MIAVDDAVAVGESIPVVPVGVIVGTPVPGGVACGEGHGVGGHGDGVGVPVTGVWVMLAVALGAAWVGVAVPITGTVGLAGIVDVLVGVIGS